MSMAKRFTDRVRKESGPLRWEAYSSNHNLMLAKYRVTSNYESLLSASRQFEGSFPISAFFGERIALLEAAVFSQLANWLSGVYAYEKCCVSQVKRLSRRDDEVGKGSELKELEERFCSLRSQEDWRPAIELRGLVEHDATLFLKRIPRRVADGGVGLSLHLRRDQLRDRIDAQRGNRVALSGWLTRCGEEYPAVLSVTGPAMAFLYEEGFGVMDCISRLYATEIHEVEEIIARAGQDFAAELQ
ncbi:MAG: hypothetical protein IIA02_16880 [Proteobacteria bacterium]|nr:hypothetical protein [Pseudomonadota bacterium]